MPARALVAQAVSTTEVFPHCQFLWLASVLAHLTSCQPVNQAQVGKGREDKDNLQNLSAPQLESTATRARLYLAEYQDSTSRLCWG